MAKDALGLIRLSSIFMYSPRVQRRILLTFALAGLALNALAGQAKTDVPIVCVILAKTGPASYIGTPEAAVLKHLEDSNKGKLPFRLQIVDSGGNVAKAQELFRGFAKNPNVIAVIGPSTSGESLALAEMAEASKIPLLSLAASRDIVLKPTPDGRTATRKWVYKFAQNDDLAADQLIRTMIARKKSRFAFLYSDDGFGMSGRSAVERVVKRFPQISMVHGATYPAALEDAGIYVPSIPADADCLLVWGTSPGPALILRSLASSGRHLPVYLSHGNASQAFIKEAGASCENAILVGSRLLRERLVGNDSSVAVLKNFRGLWNSTHLPGPPSHFAGHARDAYLMVGALMSSPTRPAQGLRGWIRMKLEKQGPFVGVTGTFRFTPSDHAGLDDSAFDVFQIQKGHFAPLKQ